MWVAGPLSAVHGRNEAASTLEARAAAHGEELVGSAGMALLGPRFPLLVKLIDPADWLSLQLHPDDPQAEAIAGPGALGKQEAWYVVATEPGAQLLGGARRGPSPAALLAAIAGGDVPRGLLESIEVEPGQLIDVPPRTLHSIGPGVLLYELQQPSDLTLRVSDWGRQPSPDRPIHAEASLRYVDLASHARLVPADDDGRPAPLVTDRFRLEVVLDEVVLHPAGRTLEVVTTVEGSALVEGDGWLEALGLFETLVVPAATPSYRILPAAGARICVATLP
jgi:mannose-6-phosphate isomerase